MSWDCPGELGQPRLFNRSWVSWDCPGEPGPDLSKNWISHWLSWPSGWLSSITYLLFSILWFLLCSVCLVIRCIWSSTDSLLNHAAMRLWSLIMKETCMVSSVQYFSHFVVFLIMQVRRRWLWCVLKRCKKYEIYHCMQMWLLLVSLAP